MPHTPHTPHAPMPPKQPEQPTETGRPDPTAGESRDRDVLALVRSVVTREAGRLIHREFDDHVSLRRAEELGEAVAARSADALRGSAGLAELLGRDEFYVRGRFNAGRVCDELRRIAERVALPGPRERLRAIATQMERLHKEYRTIFE